MSTKILQSIDMELTPASIGRAIREVRRIQEELRRTMAELVQILMREGIEVARMQIVSLGAFDTGELEGSIAGYYVPAWRTGWIYAGAPYAVFVEYGTGIVGANAPHPGLDDNDWNTPIVTANGKTYAGYDSQGHDWDGWVYRSDKDGKFHWTAGYVSRPFMYNTLRWLEEAAPERASELFAQM